MIVQVVLKSAFLIVESYGKQSVLYSQYRVLSEEETGGIIHNTLFWWINPLLARGSRINLHPDDLPNIPRAFSSDVLRQAVLRAWDQRG